MRIVIDDLKWQNLQKKLAIKAPLVIRKMGANVIGNTAGGARLKEQKQANSLGLGRIQHTVRDGVVIERQMLVKTKAGYVSTTAHYSTGPFKMSHFGYELARQKNTVQAGYTSQLANLWAHPTKPYTSDSPFVGRVGRRRTFWQAGMSRPSKYNWTRTRDILSQEIPRAIRRTEIKFDNFLEKTE